MTKSRYQSFIESSSIQGANATYIEAFYERFLDDPDSVDDHWRAYFRLIQDQNGPREVAHSAVVARFERLAREPHRVVAAEAGFDAEAAAKQAGVLRLINYYRMRGHQAAKLDPLGLVVPTVVPDLDPAFHDLGPEDMETVFNTGTLAAGPDRLPLNEIIKILKSVYTDTIGAEYMYLTETAEKRWIQNRLEPMAFKPKISTERKLEVLHQLVAAEGLERYLHNRYVGQKRFSLEGGDALIPAMDEVLHACAARGVDEIVIGMAHRGRLNVLVNVLGKSPKDLFAEFEGKYSAETLQKAGDVKYHMGFSTDVDVGGKRLHLVLAFNPSHLEFVNPVVEGSVKARQVLRGGTGEKIVPVLIHGDSAFAGQGVVMETLQLSKAHNYGTGGTLHIITNNQIGFTTPSPIEAEPGQEVRTSRYCTDLAKMLEAPVFHVNGDDPEAVVFVMRLAMDFRNEFHKDVIVDICCYRRLGHNEADEPAVTSPMMYAAIRKHPTPLTLYARKLEEQGVLPKGDIDQLTHRYRDGLDQGENIIRNTLGLVGNKHTVDWSKYRQGGEWDSPAETTLTPSAIRTLSDKMLALPEGFTLHPRVKKIYEDRVKMAADELPMDWGFAETMAYASLVNDGFSVRLSGQDAQRGTFFHRHATVHDFKTGDRYTALQQMGHDKVRFDVTDTLLSEVGVLGFEYGYATTLPDTLVIWEAQFGDFANGAQVMFDQFISSGYAKWGRMCGLVCFLPHGYEGQGPEHSSARLERFLQLCAENNQQVCVPSTPAQMFHMLRRQMKRSVRIPLMVMTPKSLLRHPLSVSPLSSLTDGCFEPVLQEIDALDAEQVKRIVFCSGKVYYELYQARQEAGLTDVALVRLEQLYPFPVEGYEAALAAFPNAKQVVWAQEEPENQGAWYQIKHRLQAHLSAQHQMLYATRKGLATTAGGYLKVHKMEQEEVIQAALTKGRLA